MESTVVGTRDEHVLGGLCLGGEEVIVSEGRDARVPLWG